MHHMTDLQPKEIYDVFDMFDTDGSGKIDFDEFYLLFCILVAHKVGPSHRTSVALQGGGRTALGDTLHGGDTHT